MYYVNLKIWFSKLGLHLNNFDEEDWFFLMKLLSVAANLLYWWPGHPRWLLRCLHYFTLFQDSDHRPFQSYSGSENTNGVFEKYLEIHYSRIPVHYDSYLDLLTVDLHSSVSVIHSKFQGFQKNPTICPLLLAHICYIFSISKIYILVVWRFGSTLGIGTMQGTHPSLSGSLCPLTIRWYLHTTHRQTQGQNTDTQPDRGAKYKLRCKIQTHRQRDRHRCKHTRIDTHRLRHRNYASIPIEKLH